MGDSRYYRSHQDESSRDDRLQKSHDHKSPLTRSQMELWEAAVKDPNRPFNEKMHHTYHNINAGEVDHKHAKLELLDQIQRMVDMKQAIATDQHGANLINFYENNMSFDLINNLSIHEVIQRTNEAESYVEGFEYH